MGYIRVLTAATALAIGLGSPAWPASEWIGSTSLAPTNFIAENLKMFVDDVQKSSDGNLKIKMHYDGVLYKRAMHKRALQDGQVQLAEIDFNQYGNEDPMYTLVNTPALAATVDDMKTLWTVMRPYMEKLFQDKGMRLLYVMTWPAQGFYTKKEFKTIADIKGQKLRISSAQQKRMGDLLGFSSTILPMAEVPQGFATGLIDAMFTSAQTGVETQAWDHVKYFNVTDVGSAYTGVGVYEPAYQKLDPKSKQALIDAGNRALERGHKMTEEASSSKLKILQQHGMITGMITPAVATEVQRVGKIMLEDWRKEASPEANKVLDAYLAAIRKK